MTVPYSSDVSTVSFAGFFKLLIRWRGSIYKLVWKDFLAYLTLHYAVTCLHVFYLRKNPDYESSFLAVIAYCQSYVNLLPVSWILGFYIMNVVTRWWEIQGTIPWPTRCAVFVSVYVRGNTETARMTRRTIMRFVCLGFVLTMASISLPVKKRFPTLRHITEAGFLLPQEQVLFEGITLQYNKYFVPFVWASKLIIVARQQGLIDSDLSMQVLLDEVNTFRTKAALLFSYDHVGIPLIYTQVVSLVIYLYFTACLVGRQGVDNPGPDDDVPQFLFYVPVFTFAQFFFFMGWLKVGEEMLNPFGEDDDDFDINAGIDKNFKNSYMIVDDKYGEIPTMTKDQYWDQKEFVLPYTRAAKKYRTSEHNGSADTVDVPLRDQVMITNAVQAPPIWKRIPNALAFKNTKKRTAEAEEAVEASFELHRQQAKLSAASQDGKQPSADVEPEKKA